MATTDDRKEIEKTENESEEPGEGKRLSEHLVGASPFGECEVCGGSLVPTKGGGVVFYQCVKCGHAQFGRGPVIGGIIHLGRVKT